MPPAPTTAARVRKKLAARDWIEAALDIMVEQSIEQVRVEPLAERLGVTKGSFYWHFKDRDALLSAVLEHWVERSTLAIIRRVEDAVERPEDRIREVMLVPFASARAPRGADIELAIRAWARRSALARDAIDRVDRLRRAYLAGLFRALGFPDDAAEPRAYAAYAMLNASSYIRTDTATLRQAAAELVHSLLTTAPDP